MHPVLLSTRVLDNATIIDQAGWSAGFGPENLLTIQPRQPARTTGQAHAIFDLAQGPYGVVPPHRVLATLFHNGEPNTATWRIRNGLGTDGTGLYDSGVMPLWPIVFTPDAGDYRSSLAYSEGVHSYHSQGIGSPADADDTYWVFPGLTNSFIDYGDTADVSGTAGEAWFAVLFRNVGAAANQYLLTKGGILQSGVFNGYYLALRSTGVVEFGVGDGTDVVRITGGDYTDNGWHLAVARWDVDGTGNIQLYLDGVSVAGPTSASAVADNNTTSALRLGISNLGSLPLSGHIARALVARQEAGGTIFPDWLEWITGYMESPVPESHPLRLGVRFASSATTTVGTLAIWYNNWVGGTGVPAAGTINGTVSTNRPDLPYLSGRYLRVDYSIGSPVRNSFLSLGRLVADYGLEPKVLYGSGNPTPEGSPPKLRNQWTFAMSPEDWESIGYLMATERGNNPETLQSWNKDVHLIDGGKTIVAVNDVLAPTPWRGHQGTVYGYISNLDGPTWESVDLMRGRLEFRGL